MLFFGWSEGSFRVFFGWLFWGSEGVAVGVVSEVSFRPLAPLGWKVVSDFGRGGGVCLCRKVVSVFFGGGFFVR